MIRVLIADDQLMVREGFSVLLNAMPDIEVAGEAVNGRDGGGEGRASWPRRSS
ncbi:Response regulator transcription factor OS=Streptomyces tendae OX=1932 GN=GUR47_19845 PE=4 SV=1 [Streptomyces tendae]